MRFVNINLYNYLDTTINSVIPGGIVLNLNYICPMPMDWNNICERLELEFRKTHEIPNLEGLNLWKHIGLPIPLILNGWVYSTDTDKQIRWRETIKWAESKGLLWVIEQSDFKKHGQQYHK